MIRRSDELFQSQRLIPRQEADVRHTNDWQPVPAFRAQSSAGAFCADGMRRLPGAEISGEQSFCDDRRTLRRNAFIVEPKRAQPRPMLLARIRDHIDQVAAVAQLA